MNCPLCNVALKVAGHRGVNVNYCPLCGGTWLERYGFDNLFSPAASAPPRPKRRILLIAIAATLVLGVCILATVMVGALKLWVTVQSWTGSLLSGKETALTSQVQQLTGRLGSQRILELSRGALESAGLSSLAGNSGFERLLSSVAAVPNLGPLVRNGVYLKVLQEAARQNVGNLADLKTDTIVSPDIREAATQVQQALRSAPGGGGAAGTVDPAVLEVMGSEVFQQLSRSGLLERLFGGARPAAPAD